MLFWQDWFNSQVDVVRAGFQRNNRMKLSFSSSWSTTKARDLFWFTSFTDRCRYVWNLMFFGNDLLSLSDANVGLKDWPVLPKTIDCSMFFAGLGQFPGRRRHQITNTNHNQTIPKITLFSHDWLRPQADIGIKWQQIPTTAEKSWKIMFFWQNWFNTQADVVCAGFQRNNSMKNYHFEVFRPLQKREISSDSRWTRARQSFGKWYFFDAWELH